MDHITYGVETTLHREDAAQSYDPATDTFTLAGKVYVVVEKARFDAIRAQAEPHCRDEVVDGSTPKLTYHILSRE